MKDIFIPLCCLLLGALSIILVVDASTPDTPFDPHDHEHGGVRMGVPSKKCDNGLINVSLDWDPSSEKEYTCYSKVKPWPLPCTWNATIEKERLFLPNHVCMTDPIKYPNYPPLSGPHRPLWPRYGEYTYLPPQRWLHSMEHGAAVFLYHPCANPEEVAIFKVIARCCLWKHIITPYKKIDPDPKKYQFAVLTWRVKLRLTRVHGRRPLIARFLRKHALNSGKEEHNNGDGQYCLGGLCQARMVSDERDSIICPPYAKDSQCKDDCIPEKSFCPMEKNLTAAIKGTPPPDEKTASESIEATESGEEHKINGTGQTNASTTTSSPAHALPKQLQKGKPSAAKNKAVETGTNEQKLPHVSKERTSHMEMKMKEKK